MDETSNDLTAILMWIILTKYEGLMHLPPKAELVSLVDHHRVAVDPETPCIRVVKI